MYFRLGVKPCTGNTGTAGPHSLFHFHATIMVLTDKQRQDLYVPQACAAQRAAGPARLAPPPPLSGFVQAKTLTGSLLLQ